MSLCCSCFLTELFLIIIYSKNVIYVPYIATDTWDTSKQINTNKYIIKMVHWSLFLWCPHGERREKVVSLAFFLPHNHSNHFTVYPSRVSHVNKEKCKWISFPPLLALIIHHTYCSMPCFFHIIYHVESSINTLLFFFFFNSCMLSMYYAYYVFIDGHESFLTLRYY